jgi:hypothetical protein
VAWTLGNVHAAYMVGVRHTFVRQYRGVGSFILYTTRSAA